MQRHTAIERAIEFGTDHTHVTMRWDPPRTTLRTQGGLADKMIWSGEHPTRGDEGWVLGRMYDFPIKANSITHRIVTGDPLRQAFKYVPAHTVDVSYTVCGWDDDAGVWFAKPSTPD
ncbi:hypothetical protein SEA_YAKULT_34 [Gordonia phage Yakult]|nr:hypothetical protein SEA_YAKULT_34 [Gordonia phage Yakult]